MKLYANIHAGKLVEGEIVTVQKGQGSNHSLHIELSGRGNIVFGDIHITEDEAIALKIHGQEFVIEKEKGKSQKGESIA